MTYKRSQYQVIKDRINEQRSKLQVIVGPRQVGKTTLINQVLEECEIPYESYSTDDVPNVSEYWISHIWDVQRMKMDSVRQPKRLLVIDEIQKVENWSEVVKSEWDRDTREKRELVVILLGSSRVMIMKGLTESLAGRFELIRIPHWTFPEMKDCFGWNLQQYIFFGGYPGSAQYIGDEKRWRNYIKDSLVESAIAKDALMNTSIQKPILLRRLFELGCSYSGELLSLTKMASQLVDAGNVTTLAGYLHLLDECGLLSGIQKFANDNARKYNSIPKYQVYNNALRTVYEDETFEDAIQDPQAWGRYVESAIGAYIVSQASLVGYSVYYWRDKSNEVDYVLQRNRKVVALEVKSGRRYMNSGLPIFEKTFSPFRSMIVGTGGLSVEEFLSMDLEILFR